MAKSSKKKENKKPKETIDSKTVKSKEEIQDEEISLNFDFNKVKSIFLGNTFKSLFIPLLMVIIIMAFAFHLRSGPISLNGLDKNVEANVHSQIQSLIAQQIDSQYPNLNPTYKQELVQEEYQKALDSGTFTFNGQTVQISDVVNQNTQYLKNAFKADNGQTYLNAIDPYHFLGLSNNYLKNGHLGTTLKEDENGNLVPYNEKKLAPIGIKINPNVEFHVWLEVTLFKLFGITPDSEIGDKTRIIFLLPVFFAMFSGVVTFFILRKFTDDLSSLFGSLLLVSIGTYVSRTVAGFVDTDAYNVFFPVLIVAFLIYGFFSNSSWKKTVLLAILAGFFMGVYMWAWTAAWFIFIFIFVSLIGYIGYIFLNHILNALLYKKEKIINIFFRLKNDFILILTFIISSVLFSYIIAGLNILRIALNGILGSTSGNVASISTSYIWPNVLSSVAELNNASFTQIISSVGGNLIFLIAMFGIILVSVDYTTRDKTFTIINRIIALTSLLWFYLIIYQNWFSKWIANSPLVFLILLFLPLVFSLGLRLFSSQKEGGSIFLIMLLSVWMAGTTYMSLNGVRFILLLAPAFAISFGLGLYQISRIINNFISKEFKIKDSNIKSKFVGYALVFILFLILYSPIYSSAKQISDGTTPNFDDAWYSVMYKINNNSQEDAIITSWWDFGHFFLTVADRGVTFDGGSQETPQAYWVGRLLLESDEDKSHDILQMLTCGGNEAHNTMLEIVNGTNSDAVKINKILDSTLGKDEEQTREIIVNNKYYSFSEEEIDKIMSYLACENPREDFLITSEDMIGKAGVWAHWGSWDFTKKYVYDNYKLKTASEIAEDIDENETLIQSYIESLNNLDKQAIAQNVKRKDLVNQWFAQYPSYIPIQGRYEYPCVLQNETLICQNGISVDTISGTVELPAEYENQILFKNLIYPTSNNKLTVVEQNSNGDIDAIITPSDKGFNILLAQSPLGTSLFTKLYFMQGYGTKYFEFFDNVESVTGVRITTWKVKWQLNETNTPFSNLNVQSVEFNATEDEIKNIIGTDVNISFDNNSSNLSN